MAIPEQIATRRRADRCLRWAGPALCVLFCIVLWACPAFADQAANRTTNTPSSAPHASTTRHHPARTRRRTAAKPSPAGPTAQAAASAPPAPPKPDWPVNDKPVDATIVWDSHGLRVDAANSRLDQIMKLISTDTGAKVEGLGPSDVRIFGTYGPGPANEVISQLLNGTGYNVLMVGDRGAGAPLQIVLSAAPTGPAPQNSARNSNQDDSEQDQPPTEFNPAANGGFMPPQMRTPQQIQEMQLRQEQIQQQLREQMIQQQQQQPPDTAAPPPQR